jgi:hypothetical protein
MKYEDLFKYVEHELQWLRYYANRETRESLNSKSDLYRDLKSIGYTKRVIPLDLRCTCARISSDSPISEKSDIENLKVFSDPRNTDKNIFTPLEIFWMKYPEKRDWVIHSLNS